MLGAGSGRYGARSLVQGKRVSVRVEKLGDRARRVMCVWKREKGEKNAYI